MRTGEFVERIREVVKNTNNEPILKLIQWLEQNPHYRVRGSGFKALLSIETQLSTAWERRQLREGVEALTTLHALGS